MSGQSRFLFTTKGIKRKPERNCLKRRMREHIRKLLPIIETKMDIALVASDVSLSFNALGKEIATLLTISGIMKKTENN